MLCSLRASASATAAAVRRSGCEDLCARCAVPPSARAFAALAAASAAASSPPRPTPRPRRPPLRARAGRSAGIATPHVSLPAGTGARFSSPDTLIDENRLPAGGGDEKRAFTYFVLVRGGVLFARARAAGRLARVSSRCVARGAARRRRHAHPPPLLLLDPPSLPPRPRAARVSSTRQRRGWP